MAVLCWTAVVLALLLSAGNGVSAVDQNELAQIVDQMLNRFTPTARGRVPPMFSVAVSIPFNSERRIFDITQVPDDGGQVRRVVDSCRVYTSGRVVAATVLRWDNVLTQCPNELVQWDDVVRACGGRPLSWADLGKLLSSGKASRNCRNAISVGKADHAEFRNLQNFNTLVRSRNPDDLLVFYVRSTPCSNRCTAEGGRWSILQSIREITNWHNHAVVFSDIFQPRSGPPIPPEVHREALQRLGGSVGATNIYRCRRGNPVRCATCSVNGRVPDYCVTDDVPFGTVSNLPSDSLLKPQRDRSKLSLSDTEGRGSDEQSEGVSTPESDTEYANTNVGGSASTATDNVPFGTVSNLPPASLPSAQSPSPPSLSDTEGKSVFVEVMASLLCSLFLFLQCV